MTSYVRVIAPSQLGQLQGNYLKELQAKRKAMLTDFGHEWERKLINRSNAIIGRPSEYEGGWTSEATESKLTIWNKLWHALFVERGRRAGKQPPLEIIQQWAQEHLGDWRLGFVIARSIGRRGIRARPNMESPGTQREMATDFFERCVKFCDSALRKAAGV